MQRSRIVVVAKALLLMLTILCCVVMTQYVSAQAQPVKTEKGLTVSPLRTESTIDPGTSQKGSLTVTNATDAQLTVRFNAEEFNVTNQQYDYAFTAESEIAKWVTYSSDEVDLAVGESKKIGYTIAVPLSAEPGGRYISLFSSTASKTGDGISSVDRVGSLLYITVTGDVTRRGVLLSLSTQALIGGTSNWSATLQNTGTAHYRSRYVITTQSIFDSRIIAQSEGSALVLPGSVRRISDVIPLPRYPGIYKVVYAIGLGDSPQDNRTHILFYAPPPAVVAMVVVFLVIGMAVFRKRTY